MNILKRLISNKIEINTEHNITIIEIKKDLSLEDYTRILKHSLYKNLLNIIPLKHLTNQPNLNIPPKKILLYKKNNIIFIISIKDTTYYISKLTNTDTIIEESLLLNLNTNDYKISLLNHTLDGNTTDTKTYNKDESKNLKFMTLPKKEALSIAVNIVESISKIPTIYNFLKITEFIESLNIITNDEYYPVISNETITLSWPRRYGQENINTKKRCNLDILLTQTREKVGEIIFTYYHNISRDYSGNISYHIKEEFQNKKYATIALSLLKELLKNNKYEGNKDLFISTTPQNIYSQKVALNNGGEIYYEGEVPKNNPLSRHSGITEVKIYRIKI